MKMNKVIKLEEALEIFKLGKKQSLKQEKVASGKIHMNQDFTTLCQYGEAVEVKDAKADILVTFELKTKTFYARIFAYDETDYTLPEIINECRCLELESFKSQNPEIYQSVMIKMLEFKSLPHLISI